MENTNIVFGSELRTKPIFAEMGKKAYLIRNGKGHYDSGKSFREKCPCCGDARKILYNGFEVKCSVCDSVKASITLREWHVEEYIVNSITVTGPDYKNAYGKNPQRDDLPRITEISGFHRTANGYSNVTHHKIPERDEFVDVTPEKLKLEFFDSNVYAFTSRAKAEAVMELLIQQDREKLTKFNTEHGTNHQYPF